MRAVSLAIGLALLGRPAGGQRTLDVSPNGTFRTLAAAVAAARSGDRIVIRDGTYHGPTAVVDKQLTIEGQGHPVLDGENRRGLIIIKADDVTVRGLTLRNVGTSFVEDRAALRVDNAHGCLIDDNHIENGFFGIYLANVTDCRVTHNTLRATGQRETESGNGIHLWTSRRITIAGNTITGHRDGIYFEFVHESDIRDNLSTENLRYGMHFMYSDDCRYTNNIFRKNGSGVAVMFTKHVEMVGNRFEDNWGPAAYGLLLKEISDSRLESNRFLHNTTGLLADGANRLVAIHNEFVNNGWAVKLDASTLDGRFEHNDFLGNSFDVASNSRSPTTTFAGNYWDGYRGYDLDRNGVGDVPHRPVRLFSLLVEHHPPALILMRSAFADLLDGAERIIPSLTPETLVDSTPAMRRNR
ncbi:MAG TPA: nitrous oxide reductase family maturation protein NosD [Gemmatimonadaceae bacterium]|jgi:nitrous oxidase accessory protein|nr:nitrous oxide reductase family maturation protein NosD [Gemmatimonadaceae bacterium]